MGRDEQKAEWERLRYRRFCDLVQQILEGQTPRDVSQFSNRRYHPIWLEVVRQALAQLEEDVPTPDAYRLKELIDA